MRCCTLQGHEPAAHTLPQNPTWTADNQWQAVDTTLLWWQHKTHLEPVKNLLDRQVTLKHPTVPQAPPHIMKLKSLQSKVARKPEADVYRNRNRNLRLCHKKAWYVDVHAVILQCSIPGSISATDAAHLRGNGLSHSEQRQRQIGKSIPIRFDLFCLCHL